MVHIASCSRFISRHTFADIMASYCSHKIIKDRAWVTVHLPFGRCPRNTWVQYHLCPTLNHGCVATGPGTRPTSFHTLHCWKNQLDWALDPQQAQENALNTVLQREHMAPSRFAMWHGLADTRLNSLHITGPSQYPSWWVDKPHLASIAATRLAVAGRCKQWL